jgi:hypothetical protein
MRNILTVVSLVLLFMCCKGTNNTDDVRKADAISDSSVTPNDSSSFYFPLAGSIKDSNSLDTFTNSWYSKMLFGLHEPILYGSQDTSEVYRFTWLRTFHKPISIRVSNKSACVLVLKVADGAGGYDVGKLVQDTTFYISKNEWNEFLLRMGTMNFWNLSSADNSEQGKDGSEWILEGKKNEKYHFVSRWTPNSTRGKEIRDCCDYLIKLSGLVIPDKEMY